MALVFTILLTKVFRRRTKTTRKGGPVDQPGMSIVDAPATRLNRPLGMLQLPAMRKDSKSCRVAGSNPARSTKFKLCFPQFLTADKDLVSFFDSCLRDADDS